MKNLIVALGILLLVGCATTTNRRFMVEMHRGTCDLPADMTITAHINGNTYSSPLMLQINNKTSSTWKLDLEYSIMANGSGWRSTLVDNFSGDPTQTKILLPTGPASIKLYPAALLAETDASESDTRWKPWPLGDIKLVMLFKDSNEKQFECSMEGKITSVLPYQKK
jgi:hypothetical protein